MMSSGPKCDLHCHSSVSDGVLAPRDLARRAHANGVQLWALTDHDETAGLEEAAREAAALGMRFVPGVEISVTWCGTTVHIVGLGVDGGHPQLREGLREVRAGRVRRARAMGERLAERGMPGAFEGALPYARNPELIGRTHFARFLVQAGHCADMQAVFHRYLGDDKPCHVPARWATLDQAVGWILAAGGRAVIAHPGRYRLTPVQFDALLDRFVELGGAGIEVVTGSHTPDQYRVYAELARRRGLLASCGSDFHSPDESRVDLGGLPPLPPRLTPVWHDWL